MLKIFGDLSKLAKLNLTRETRIIDLKKIDVKTFN